MTNPITDSFPKQIHLCECGCGQPSGVYTNNDKRSGQVKGQPKRFIHGHNHRIAQPISEQFWKHVDICDPSQCWNWRAYKTKKGYGIIHTQQHTDRAHRVAWELTYGSIPDGLCVCHKCDNRSCCNPNHLFLATHYENIQDMVNKGRQQHNSHKGEENPQAKLTNDQVIEIRNKRSNGESLTTIATIYNISISSVSGIAKHRTWTHIE